MLTNDEMQALDAILEEAIVKSREEDDGDPIFHEVNTDDVNPFADKQTQDVVYTNLAKQGLIECSAGDDQSGNVFDCVCITRKGLETLKSAKGVH